ncbi:MAG TPA: hypothetical protein VNJ01_12235 [Bacteriovoracaceae bacterium]|nr:hypothetical protein [Bacteriovoracaceae bacterium]
MKLIIVAFTFLSLSAFAQDPQGCNQVGWTNQGILRELLSERPREMMTVKTLDIDSRGSKITYLTEEEGVVRTLHYKICGHEITFE